jgi:enoyl-CoA hydratase/carnithine racemase
MMQSIIINCTGGKISVKRLWQWGVVNCIVGDDSSNDGHYYGTPPTDGQAAAAVQTVDEALWHYWQLIDRAAPRAVQLVKRLIRRVGVEGHSWPEDLKSTRQTFIDMLANEEAVYGMMAFLQRQPANWMEFHASKL